MSVQINKHGNMLIIGRAETQESLKEISYEDSYDQVYKKYGNSDITNAFALAQEYGCENIFVMNLRNSYDYLEIADAISDNDFTYIVPVSKYVSDTFNDPYNNDAKYSYISYLLSLTSKNEECQSVVVATDKHASLYETIDDFIADMNYAEGFITKGVTANVNTENIIFVANNLKDTVHANVILAATLCSSPLAQYPAGDFGEAIFNIDHWDGIGKWSYFKNHTSPVSTSLENFLNYSSEKPFNMAYISRIVKGITREIDFSDFCGRMYNEYMKLRIQERLAAFLDAQIGITIYDYDIEKIVGVTDRKNKGCVSVRCYYTIWPLNVLAECNLEKNVKI